MSTSAPTPDFLIPAIKAEKNGVGIFYFDKNKADRYSAYSYKIGPIPTGFVHNISSIGINVKPQFETLQFFKWFGDWKNNPEHSSKIVDDDGKPLVVYHGTDENFTVFDMENVFKNFPDTVKKENKGIPSVLYVDKKIEPLFKSEGLQLPNSLTFGSVMHNIASIGINVNGIFRRK